MYRAAQCLTGTHDFHSFETQWANRSSSVRTVSHLAVCRAAGAEIFAAHAISQSSAREPESTVGIADRTATGMAVLVVPGNGGNRAGRAGFAEELRQHGLAVLLMDYRVANVVTLLLAFFAFAYAFAKGYEGTNGVMEGIRFGVLTGIVVLAHDEVARAGRHLAAAAVGPRDRDGEAEVAGRGQQRYRA